EARLAAGRDVPGVVLPLAPIDEVTERLMPLEIGKMLAPLLRLTLDVVGVVDPSQAQPRSTVRLQYPERLRNEGESVVRTRLPQPVRCGLREVTEALLAVPNCVFHQLAGCIVARDQRDSDDRPFRILHRRHCQGDRDRGPVL